MINERKAYSSLKEKISWAFYDWANSSFSSVIITFIFPAYFVQHIAETRAEGTASWGLLTGSAGALVALGGPLLGAFVDQAGWRKTWIALFTLGCILCAASLWFVKPHPEYKLLAMILVGTGIIFSEYAFILYNAMLPELVEKDQIGRWSGWGWSFGYTGGVLCLVCSLGILTYAALFFDTHNAQDVRATFVFVALWYLLFSLPFFLFTPSNRPTKNFAKAAKEGFEQVKNLLTHIGKFRNIFQFFIAWMIYTDGLVTLFAFGGVYAAATFNLNTKEVLIFGITLNVSAGIGAASLAFLDDKIGSKLMIVLSLICLTTLGICALSAQTLFYFWLLALFLGVFVGPVQASSRAYLARLAPPELRNQLFGFYFLSGKVTSFVGPLLVGWITYLSGSPRLGMIPIIVFFAIGLLLTLPLSSDRTSKE